MTEDYKWYVFPIDMEGNLLTIDSNARPIMTAGCQRDALEKRRYMMNQNKIPAGDGMLVVRCCVPYKDLDVHKDEYDYWIYDRDGFCCSPGEGPEDPFA